MVVGPVITGTVWSPELATEAEGPVMADRMACGCRGSALSVGQVGDDREVVGWPHAVYRRIAA